MKYTIKIPKPCHEDWDKMTPTEQGRFCAVCTKEVLDFTQLSDKELVKRIKSGQSMCGRFRPTQLNREIDYSRKTIFPRIGMFLGITSLLSFSQAAFSQEVKPKTEVVQPGTAISQATYPKKAVSDSVTIQGRVFYETGEPMEFAVILLKGTNMGRYADSAGKFSFKIPISDFEQKMSLVFEYVGYVSKEVAISSTSRDLHVTMMENPETIGEIIIIKKPSFIRRLTSPFRWVGNGFRRRKH